MKTIVSLGRWLWTVKFEAAWVILGIILIFKLPGLLSAVDSTSAGLDPGVLSFIATAVLAVLAGVLLFFAIIKLSFSSIVDNWWDNEDDKEGSKVAESERRTFVRDWKAAAPSVRLSLAVGLLIAVLVSVAGVTIAAF